MIEPKAVVVLGMQYDHLVGGALPYPGTVELLTPIRNYLANDLGDQDIVIAGREWHPENHFSFTEPWDGHEPLGEHCLQGSKGAKIHPGIARWVDYTISYGMHRGSEAYSAFAGKTLRPVQSLEEILSEKNIFEMEVIGVRFAVEVAQTAFDANAVKFRTSINLPLTDYIKEDQRILERLQNTGVTING